MTESLVTGRVARGPLAAPLRLALLPIGLAWALVAEWVRLRADWPIGWVALDIVPGIAFLVAGQVAWHRRPGTRIGPLMVATGFAWYVGTFAVTSDAAVDGFIRAFQGYYDVLIAWLVLAYPTGFLRSVAARVVIGAWFTVLVGRTVFRLAVTPRSTSYDLADPSEVERYVRDVALRDTGENVFLVVAAMLALVVLVLAVRRLLTETDVGRRVAAPVLLGGVVLAIGIVLEVATLASAGTFAERKDAWELGHVITCVASALVSIGFVVGIVRGRLARGTVADLVVELGDGPERPRLRDVLARALGDPSLEIAYAVPESRRFVDADGRGVGLPSPTDQRRAMTRLEAGGRTVAVLIHDPALSEQAELVRSVGAATRLALENERLAAEVRTQLEAVRASRARIVAAGDAERRRVERDLHDGAQQRLVTLALSIQVARAQADGSNPALASSLDQASEDLAAALTDLRALARGIHPAILADEGLAAAVEALADRSPANVTLRAPAERFTPTVEATVYFVVAEALTNVVKYARASAVTVSIEREGESLHVEVADDGVGGADPTNGSGLAGLDDRVAAAGGRLTVTSVAGAGTVVRAEIPCA